MIFVGLKRYFISTISNHSLSVQLRVLTAETMEISASLNKLVVVKGQAGSTTEAVLFRSIFCKIRWEQQVLITGWAHQERLAYSLFKHRIAF